MSDKHADARDKKLAKKRHGMQVSNRGIFILLPLLGKPNKKKKRKR